MNSDSDAHSASEDVSLVITVDGASRNTGRLDVQAAYGIYFHRRARFNTAGLLHHNPTHQRAEIYAAIKAVEICCAIVNVRPSAPVIRPIEIRSDSAYLVNTAAPWISAWRRNNYMTDEGSPVVNLDLLTSLEGKMAFLQSCGVDIRFRQVFREETIDADKLANAFLDKINQNQMQPARVDSRAGEGKTER